MEGAVGGGFGCILTLCVYVDYSPFTFLVISAGLNL